MAKSGDKKRQRDAEEAPAGLDGAAGQTSNPPTKKARVESHRSLFVRSLPPTTTSESLTEFFSQHYPVKHATVVLDPKTKTSRGYGFVSFADPEDAIEAKEKLNNELFDGRRLRLDIAQPRHRDAAKAGSEVASKVIEEKRKREEQLEQARKPPKLIIRNLPWSIKSSDQLAKLFQSFGKVKYADLPNNKGKLSGFGFVTLRGRKNAEKAMEAINGKVVDGRTLAVDWAVDKQTWEKQKDGAEADEGDAGSSKSPKAKKSKKAKEEDNDEDPNMTQEDRDLMNFFKNYGDNLEDEEESDEEGESDGEDKDEVEDEDEDEDVDVGTGESGASEDEDDQPKKQMTDNSTTLFIRNLPYTTTDETLKAHFAKFGAVRYARVVMDRATDRPAGTGFVCFFNMDDCMACLKGAPRHRPAPTLSKHSILQDETVDPEGKYTLEGRVLQVAQAVSKDEATRLAEAGPGRKGKEKDKRRLFLLSEGAIPKGSPLYNKLPPSEIKMREASAKQRKKLIESNPSLHLSLTRLAIRNLPHNLGSKELKALAREAIVGFAKDVKEGRRQPLSKEENSRGGEQDKEAERRRKEKGKGVVRQAKIVFETKEGSKVDEKTGAGRSRGYGFIEYSSHRWALMGMRWLNGHALKNEAGKTQRLIVEFAIENANVVQRRRAQEERTKQLGPRPPKTEKEADGGKSKGAKKGKSRKGEKEGDGDKLPPTKEARKNADAKLAMRTKIIARKRMMRKKKAKVRTGKK
ncbi:RNA recognition motif-containing protein [Madurella fahalii]|uniref:RNA recognition motif-containing protein n=1 Tax=Madurella fahalii TaxID=1157608 RepID=A0ABQ0GSN6_9PEZI